MAARRRRQDAAAATANAWDLQSVERALHLNLELGANRWLTGHPAVIRPAVFYYRLYYAVIIGVLVPAISIGAMWAWERMRQRSRWS